jgi:hypothetical protein
VDTAAAAPHTLTSFEPPLTRSPAERPTEQTAWTPAQRPLFRFFFVYFLLQVEPWNWFAILPGARFVFGVYGAAVDWLVRIGNARVFQVRETLIPVNGSGDTSYAWAQMWVFLSLAAIGCVVWTVLDRKRTQYDRLAFWLRMIVRYYVATAALSYGIIKLFALQMSFPAISQLATPLGDLLPMRFSWLFIGYSVPYQIFSGVMETVAGLLLFYRRTVTLGILAATGAFLNVVMINLSYDVPVKLYAAHLLFSCLFLLALDARRLTSFLVLNRGAPPTHAYEPGFAKTWQRWGSVTVKVFFVWQFLLMPLKAGYARYQMVHAPVAPGPFAIGIYDVRQFVVGHDTLPATGSDSLRWKDVIFDSRSAGSVNTTDPLFWQRYRRGYFRYRTDTSARTVAVWKTSSVPRDSTFLFTARYEVADSTRVRLHTMIRGDSVHVELVRVPRHFQLAERQFHWISEYNR